MSNIQRWFPGTSVGDWTGGQFGGGASKPGAPGTLALTSPSASDNSAIDLSWAQGLSGSEAVSGYHVQISTDGSSWSDKVADTGSSSTSYTATGLTQSTQYWFRVSAINSVGESDFGNEPSATSATVFAYTTTGSPTTRTYTVGGTSYKSLHWTSTGNFVLTANLDSVKFDMWVVAGGGGGGGGQYDGGYWGGSGGGGAGGAKAFTNHTLSNTTHNMAVGAGGAGGAAGGWPANGVAGTYSSASGQGTSGGGYGALYNYVGGNGGSGGGGGGWQGYGGGSGTSGEGNDGGQGGAETQSPMNGAGGGGKGGVGQGHTSSPSISNTVNGGAGGTGGTNDYADGTTSGVGVGQWAGGGGGGSQVGGAATHGGGAGGSSAAGSAGTANTGGGGGGAGSSAAGSTGGSGSIVIRWET